eukprot:Seg2268.1 transcript_id=Seg2268.1/GoldUCD/mRNA.D3Y31 product=Calbindin-32 protein_id=Seg2268.1/GoldUCD/D3Y31
MAENEQDAPLPFITSWKGKTTVNSVEFLDSFKKYDKDNNGYIDGGEVDLFLADLLAAKNPDDSDVKALRKFKNDVLKKYDKNKDNRIELAELSKILPTEDNFLLQFRLQNNDLTSVEFMQVWKHYDTDCNGYLDAKEIQGFCYDLMSKKKSRRLNVKRVDEFAAGIVELYDKNKDGKLDIRELQKLLPVEKNYLSRIFQNRKSLNDEDFNVIFNHYDQNNDGSISEDEIAALMRDLTILSGKADSPTNIEKMQKDLMKHVDKNNDGKIQRKELSILFTQKKAMKLWKS